MKKVLSFDFGASSGRAMLAELSEKKIVMTEIHRFSNDPVMMNGRMYWDVLRLFFEIKSGITKALAAGGFDAIGIDTWGVDFGLIDKRGRLIGNPVHYRDIRTEKTPEEVFQLIPKEELYQRTGSQFLRINTLYQLMYLKNHEPEQLELAEKLLLMPDLFGYLLTGEIHAEASIVSTTNLFDPKKRDWDMALIRRLGLPESLFPAVIKAGEIYGYLTDEICEELGCQKVPVVAVCGHDTASAVVATPSTDDDFVYISCGTWSLFGIELPEPVISEKAAAANFTNEGGYKDTVRFLKNIMGLWLIQESRRQWKREGTEVGFDQLEKEALAAKPFVSFIDVDDPSFETAGNLPKRVQEYCRRTGQPVPETRGEIMRCIYQSLAMKYKYTFRNLCEIGQKNFRRINILGGGIKDTLLCRMTADACGAEVLAGPTEATVMGNIAVAYAALGEIKDFGEIRQVISDSTDLKRYLPENSAEWEAAYQTYISVIAKQ